MSPGSARATSATRKATLMRVPTARLVRTLDRGAQRGAIAPRRDAAPAGAEDRFPAYAAHELRGSIALQRTLAEVALADPNADRETLREMGERVVVACERQELLLEALLTLARSECGRLRREPIDLAAIAAEALRARDRHGLGGTTALEPAHIVGDPHLVERLVANLVVNAVRHNLPAGRVDVATHTAVGRATFTIANTGPLVAPGELPRLFQPFQRLHPADRAPEGVGLGLAIVQAIATSHDATITAAPLARGGLRIEVAFPALD